MFKIYFTRIFARGLQQNKIRKLSTKPSYYHCVGEDPLSHLTLGQLSEKCSYSFGDRTAVVSCHQKKKLTFRSLLEEADRLAAGFLKLGFQKEDRIGIWAPNLVEWYIAFIACARGGFVMVSMNPFYQANEAENLIKQVKIKGLICGDVFRKQDYYHLLKSICPELEDSKPGKIYSDRVPSLRTVVHITEENKKGTFKFTDILNMADEDTMLRIKNFQNKIKFDDPCNIQFTSGTTGMPKAPVQSHFNIVNNGYFSGKRVGLHQKHHTICLQNPLFHVFGTIATLTAAVNHGATIVLPNDTYNPEKNLSAIVQEGCTVIYGTPTMYVDLVSQQRKRNENMKAEIALCGGALCPPALFKDMLDILKVKAVKSIYGLTETTASVFFSMDNENEYYSTQTVGKVHDHLEVKVVDPEGHLVPMGSPGELLVRGYTTMVGYFENEEKTKEVIDKNGWFRTGDQFILTEDGYGKVVGRIKDLIIRGGENIYPKEIEEFLITYPDIIEVQVVGVPHERLGEEVCAAVKTKSGNEITIEQLYEFCKGKLSTYKIPTQIKTLEKFPTTTSGKVQKNKIIEFFSKNKVFS
uniref:Medium-chain acyl-CoA ligase ACSF2, mitochondrial n=1 Tax=Diabrotica virgifera virgifera TaxID=50390 RepID=A0A6P7G296_DIAVI